MRKGSQWSSFLPLRAKKAGTKSLTRRDSPKKSIKIYTEFKGDFSQFLRMQSEN
jgi:hypothetical protein